MLPYHYENPMIYGWLFVIVAFVIYVVSFFVPGFGALIIPAICALIYVLYKHYTHESPYQVEVREKAERAEELRSYWSEDHYSPPTPAEMSDQITKGFAALSPNLGLNYGFAKRIKDVQIAIYAQCDLSQHLHPIDLRGAVTGFRTACIQGLVSFTRTAPKGIAGELPRKPSKPLFYVQK